ncbi:MAG: glycosyltransferase family 4 protein [Bacteroidales bacterium]
MRVLHISTSKSWGGGEQQVLYLLKFLSSEEHVLLCPDKAPLKEKARETQTQILMFRSLPQVMQMIFLPFGVRYVCWKYKIQIIHAHDSHAHTLVWLTSMLPGLQIPIIVSRRVTLGKHRGILSTLKYNSNRITHYICISEAVRESLKDVVKKSNKLKRIYSGIDPSRFPYQSPSPFLKEEMGWPSRSKIVGNIASLVKAKDHPTFLKTAALLLEKRQDLRFVIVGEGPEKARLEALINELQISKWVVFTGFRYDIEKVLPSLDILLFTSQSEGLGTIILDAMSCGVPVVATNAGGIAEIIHDGENGLLVEPGDASAMAEAVFRLLNDEGLRTKIIRNASIHVRNFNARNMAAQTLQIYSETLNISPSIKH